MVAFLWKGRRSALRHERVQSTEADRLVGAPHNLIRRMSLTDCL